MTNVVEFHARDSAPAGQPSHSYAELAVTTNFSFLRGASHAKDFILQALALGLTGIGIADRNSVAGVVRAYHALEEWNEHVRNEKDSQDILPPGRGANDVPGQVPTIS